jgi:DNA-binding NtrC family response regulator
MRTRVLLVEPDPLVRRHLEAALAWRARIESHACFDAARTRVAQGACELLVTNMRLGAFNGLHLVYLSQRMPPGPRAVVYTEAPDAGLAREVQRAGAFYEVAARLLMRLPRYLMGPLPPQDRRDGVLADRRHAFRGGRRCCDQSPSPL